MKQKNQHLSERELFTMKQTFLSNAITDVASWVRLADTKVSILMAMTVALISAGISLFDKTSISEIPSIQGCTYPGLVIVVLSIVLFCSLICVFAFAMRTIRGHAVEVEYLSKWYLAKPIGEYGFKTFKKDVRRMKAKDIIDNTAVELYKLNAIHRRKLKLYQRALDSFCVSLIVAIAIGMLVVWTL